jgi:2-dehydro-3-deoxyphosphogluconate aldolase / (4S)-4-hydroxy-2-oxoglutarate aldolase
MNDSAWVADWFAKEFAGTRVMAILRGLGAERSLVLAGRAWEAGIRVLELPVQSAADLDALAAVAAAAAERDLRVGAGTVLDPGQLPSIREAGAAYTVSPGTDDDVIRASLDAGLPTLPGVASATEIQRCRRFGLTWLKAFPAETLGPRWIRAMHGPFPEAVFVATGGVSSANAEALLSAGTRVVAFGSALDNPAELAHMSRLAAHPA